MARRATLAPKRASDADRVSRRDSWYHAPKLPPPPSRRFPLFRLRTRPRRRHDPPPPPSSPRWSSRWSPSSSLFASIPPLLAAPPKDVTARDARLDNPRRHLAPVQVTGVGVKLCRCQREEERGGVGGGRRCRGIAMILPLCRRRRRRRGRLLLPLLPPRLLRHPRDRAPHPGCCRGHGRRRWRPEPPPSPPGSAAAAANCWSNRLEIWS
jgi:hypothetical protein